MTTPAPIPSSENVGHFSSSPSRRADGMERVLYNTHVNVCRWVLRHSRGSWRSVLEYSVLLGSIFGFGVLFVAHVHMIYRGVDAPISLALHCLDRVPGVVPDNYTTNISSHDVHVTHVLLTNKPESFVRIQRFQHDDVYRIEEPHPRQEPASCNKGSFAWDNEVEDKTSSSFSPILYSFARTKGYLFLDESTRRQHNISSQYIYISETDPRCFGEPLLQAWIHSMLGETDTVVWNWLLGYSRIQGYVYNPRTETLVDLSLFSPQMIHHLQLWRGFLRPSGAVTVDEQQQQQQNHNNKSAGTRSATSWRYLVARKLGVVLSSLLLFFITTTLVSFTLRETQDRMLEFTRALQLYVQLNLPLQGLITRHVLENLVFCPIMVGIMFFLMETYRGDKLLAFWVLSIVWVSEVFSMVSLRSREGMQFFPKIFFLLFLVFHIYYMSCPFGFHYTALTATSCFMLHSMLFFWNRYELPTVAHGHISLDRPRLLWYETMSTAGNNSASNSPNNDDNNRSPLPQSPTFVPAQQEEEQANQAATIATIVQQQQQRSAYPSMNSLFGGGSSAADHQHRPLTRPPSYLFHSDEEEEGSYMYMLNGEIVLHRHDFQSSSGSTTRRTSSAAAMIPQSVAVPSVEDDGTLPPRRRDTSVSPPVTRDVLVVSALPTTTGEDDDSLVTDDGDELLLEGCSPDQRPETTNEGNEEQDRTPRMANSYQENDSDRVRDRVPTAPVMPDIQ